MAVRSLLVPATAVRGHGVSVTGGLCHQLWRHSRYHCSALQHCSTAALPMFDVCHFAICHQIHFALLVGCTNLQRTASLLPV